MVQYRYADPVIEPVEFDLVAEYKFGTEPENDSADPLIETKSTTKKIRSGPVFPKEVEEALHLHQDRRDEVPQELVKLLEDRKVEERKAPRLPKNDEGLIEVQAAAAEVGANRVTAAAGSSAQLAKVHVDDLADGQAGIMPTTCVDDFYEQRSIKDVSARGPFIGNVIDIVAVTPRLAPQIAERYCSFKQDTYAKNSDYMKTLQENAPAEHTALTIKLREEK